AVLAAVAKCHGSVGSAHRWAPPRDRRLGGLTLLLAREGQDPSSGSTQDRVYRPPSRGPGCSRRRDGSEGPTVNPWPPAVPEGTCPRRAEIRSGWKRRVRHRGPGDQE